MKIFSVPWMLLCLGCFAASQLVFADDADIITDEYQVKAAYLYNFTKFITWTADDLQEFQLCILGDDPFGDAIKSIENRTVAGKTIKVLRFDNLTALRSQSRPHCHITFISSSINNTLIIKDVSNTLIVGESNDFAALGGMIGFINKQDKIKLQINPEAVKRGGLKISAKLLEVAEIIKEDIHD